MKEKIKELLSKEYSENVLTDFSIKTQKLYDVFGYEFKLGEKNISEPVRYGGLVLLNEKYKEIAISNISILNIDIVYPKLMFKFIETNLENYKEFFSELLEYYDNFKDDVTLRLLLRKYIIMCYGCLGNRDSEIYSNNIHLVSEYVKTLFSDLYQEFNSHIIYIDTDSIFFRNYEEIEEKFEDYFNNLNMYDLTYDISKSKFGFFINKKRYMIEEFGQIKIKGLKHYDETGLVRGGSIYIG